MRETAGSAAAPAARCRNCRRGSFMAFLSAMWGALFRLDIRRLDDRPPFLDLGLLIGTKRLRRLPLALRNFKALLGEALTYSRIAQRAHGRGIELADDVLRRAPGRK